MKKQQIDDSIAWRDNKRMRRGEAADVVISAQAHSPGCYKIDHIRLYPVYTPPTPTSFKPRFSRQSESSECGVLEEARTLTLILDAMHASALEQISNEKKQSMQRVE